MGRPSLYSQDIIDQIEQRLSKGEPLAAICREEGMPAYTTVWNWMQDRPSVAEAIGRAREAGEDWLAAECLQIADTQSPGVIEKHERDKDGNLVLTERKTEDMLQHRRLQIETRLKLLAKWNPKKYGDQVNVTGHVTLEQLVSGSMAGKPEDAP